MNKDIQVAFISHKIKDEFQSLNEGKFEDKELYKFINRALNDLKINPFCGYQNTEKIVAQSLHQKLWNNQLMEI